MKGKLATLSLIILAACGGGGSAPGPTKSPEAESAIHETEVTTEPSQ